MEEPARLDALNQENCAEVDGDQPLDSEDDEHVDGFRGRLKLDQAILL